MGQVLAEDSCQKLGGYMQRQWALIWIVFVSLNLVVIFSSASWGAFVDNGDGTVTDTVTGLMWQQGDGHNDSGERTWQAALAYCEGCTEAGYTDWRLPNIRELESIVDWSTYSPAIDPVFDCRSSHYWSSSTYVDYPDFAWFVDFGNGYVNYYGRKDHDYYVRCVRGGPGGSFDSLTFPLQGSLADRTVTLSFGANWHWGECPEGVDKVHAGIDLSAQAGEHVYAAHSGTVRAKFEDKSENDWKWCVTIENDDQTRTTVYWHVDPLVNQGEYVTQGQKIATVADMGDNTHFHFGFREAPYSNIANHGALPQNACGGDPAWPEHFVDPLQFLGNLDHFSFSSIGNQNVDTPFVVTITARDQNGDRLWGFNKEADLTSILARVSPTEVDFINGQAHIDNPGVTIGNPGRMRLKCDGYGAYGCSNYFDVSGDSSCDGNIFGQVTDASESGISQAGVTLYNGQNELIAQHTTDADGDYSFSGLDCGEYIIQAEKDGYLPESKDGIYIVSTMSQKLDDIVLSSQESAGKPPVILLPGFMGSTTWTWFPIPRLSDDHPTYDLKIYGQGRCGWNELREALKENFSVYDCPWDWTLKSEKAYEEFLKPTIDNILSSSDYNKVNIIAHSMGGLVARAYIQSEDYEHDINKLAMVGTPHLGSCNPYYIWEGGDPKTLDDITDSGWIQYVNPYTRVVQQMWRENHKFIPPYFDLNLIPKSWVRDFVQKEAPSLRQLMFTQDFLMDENQCWGVESTGNENVWLKDLNYGNGPFYHPSQRMSPDGSDGKVEAKVFVGNELESTIRYIQTLNRDDPSFTSGGYKDGKPKFFKKYVQIMNGDGTVPFESAVYPYDEGWAAFQGALEAEHMSLIKKFKSELVNFMGEGYALSSKASSYDVQQLNDENISNLSISSIGDIRVLVTNPNGKSTGIDPQTEAPIEDIPNSVCTFRSESGGIHIENPIDGTYTITYFGASAQDYQINIAYQDEEDTQIKRLHGFCPPTQESFILNLDPSSTPQIEIIPAVQAPAELQADPYLCNESECTQLTWSENNETEVGGYNVYSIGEREPYFNRVATVGAGTTTYQTDDLWSSNSSVQIMSYAVTAETNDGSESFFSEMVQNNDRDHDGLSDEEEGRQGTDMNNPDTDGDGLKDGEEEIHSTNPLEMDTDGDGFNDKRELEADTDPLDIQSKPSQPEAYFSASPTSGEAPLTVEFQDESGGEVISWLWEFGDGQNSTEQNVTYVYNDAGNFTVSLSATGAEGTDIFTQEELIDVRQPQEFSITVSASPEGGGSVDGEGQYPDGQEVRVTANPAEGYAFVNWTEGGSQVSTATEYTFTVTTDRDLVANFALTGSLQVNIQPPEAAESGAQWRRVGTMTWYDTGEIETDVPVGTYEIEFRPAPGWMPEGTVSAQVQEDQTTTITGSYVEQDMALPGVIMLLMGE